MALDLVSVKNELIAKSGYSITPQTKMLEDLRALLANMSTVRSTSPNTCTGHTAFGGSYAGHLSVGDFHSVVSGIKGLTCSCQSQTSGCTALGYACTCNTDAGCGADGFTCSCDSDYEGCSDGCGGECGCNGNCACDSNNTCACNTDSGCGADGYVCTCNSQGASCPCNSLYSA